MVQLVDDHGYPPVLYFFWSHPISENKLDKIKKSANTDYFITLEFYDAKRIAQDITDHYPHLLNHLIKKIHKIDINNEMPINIQQRAFYEYLLLSKDSTNLKNVIVDANIMSHLLDGGKSIQALEHDLKDVNIRTGSLKGRLQMLAHAGKVDLIDGIYSLSRDENLKLENIKLRELSRKQELIDIIKKEISKNTDKDLASGIVELITTAYEESLSVQITESNFEPPKLQIFKSTIQRLKVLISTECGLSESDSDALAKKLMELAGDNDYLSEHCSAKLCVNLLADSKLEKYIENKHFYIYLDAPVLIPYLITIIFGNKTFYDKSIRNINLMREHINSLKNKRLRVSNEHFEETVRHFTQAEKLSQFVTSQLIEQLGESKNVYFNFYIQWSNSQGGNLSFDEFIYAFLGLDSDDLRGANRFDVVANCMYGLLTSGNFDVVDNKDSISEEFVERIRRKFIRESHTFRPYRAIENDVYCACILCDNKEHLDSKGYFSTPMLITLDASQYLLRTIIRKEKKHAEWLVYTPQRAIERLSLIGLKISSKSLKDGVLATISDEYFFKENSASLLDTLAIIIGDNRASEGQVIKLVTSLKRKVNEESLEQSEINIEQYNNISYVLLFIHREFKDEFEKIIKLFNDSSHKEELMKVLISKTKGKFDEDKKEVLRNEIKKLIMQM